MPFVSELSSDKVRPTVAPNQSPRLLDLGIENSRAAI